MTLSQRNILLMFSICVSQITGCAQVKPPVAELDDAAQRVESARSAGAATYAPVELRVAQARLSQARNEMRAEDYEQAQMFAEETQVAAELAMNKARLGRARENSEKRTRENAQLRGDLDFPGRGVGAPQVPATDQSGAQP